MTDPNEVAGPSGQPVRFNYRGNPFNETKRYHWQGEVFSNFPDMFAKYPEAVKKVFE
jgi:hypothetical protein